MPLFLIFMIVELVGEWGCHGQSFFRFVDVSYHTRGCTKVTNISWRNLAQSDRADWLWGNARLVLSPCAKLRHKMLITFMHPRVQLILLKFNHNSKQVVSPAVFPYHYTFRLRRYTPECASGAENFLRSHADLHGNRWYVFRADGGTQVGCTVGVLIIGSGAARRIKSDQ